MIYGSQFRGVRRVNQVNGQNAAVNGFPTSIFGARVYGVSLSASYQTIVNVSGRGALNFAAIAGASPGGVTGLRITIDGRQIFLFSAALSSGFGVCAVGSVMYAGSSTTGGISMQPIAFVSSLLVEAFFNTAGGGTPLAYLNYEVDQ